jgi:hypothetical protein
VTDRRPAAVPCQGVAATDAGPPPSSRIDGPAADYSRAAGCRPALREPDRGRPVVLPPDCVENRPIARLVRGRSGDLPPPGVENRPRVRRTARGWAVFHPEGRRGRGADHSRTSRAGSGGAGVRGRSGWRDCAPRFPGGAGERRAGRSAVILRPARNRELRWVRERSCREDLPAGGRTASRVVKQWTDTRLLFLNRLCARVADARRPPRGSRAPAAAFRLRLAPAHRPRTVRAPSAHVRARPRTVRAPSAHRPRTRSRTG